MMFSCDDDDDNPQPTSDCGPYVEADDARYSEALNSSLYTLDTAWIEGDCVSILISSSCCGNTDNWELDLVDSDGLAESFPPQRFIALDFINNDECQAICLDTFSFDMGRIDRENYDTILLNLNEFSDQLVWSR